MLIFCFVPFFGYILIRGRGGRDRRKKDMGKGDRKEEEVDDDPIWERMRGLFDDIRENARQVKETIKEVLKDSLGF